MKEELQNALAKFIETTLEAKDFCLEQAPDVINQLLLWELVVSLIQFVGGALLLLITIIFLMKAVPKMKEGGHLYTHDLEVPVCFGLVISGLISFAFISYGLDFLKIILAPKVYLLEYAANAFH